MEYTIGGNTKFKIINGVICGPNGEGEYTNKYPGYDCSTQEIFEKSVNFIYMYLW